MKIGAHPIGPNHPVYVIAEIGSNHGGDLDTAKSYIETAAWAGANAAKFQFFHPDRLYPGRHTPGAIPESWLPELDAACKAAGVDFLCSVFDRDTLNAYLEVDPVAVKIASPESQNRILMVDAGCSGVPVLVGLGATGEDHMPAMSRWMDDFDWVPMHCTSAYPCPDDEANLSAIPRIAFRLDAPVGLSDHTLHGPAPAIAASFGASIIEKHLTFNRTLPGPDHGFAVEPAEFRQMVDHVRRVRAMLGDGVKRVMPSEDASDRRAAA